MNVKEFYQQNDKLILSILGTFDLICIYYAIFLLSSNGIIPVLYTTKINAFGIQFDNPVTVFTAIFFHGSFDHINNDASFLAIIGIPYFYYYGLKRGMFYYFLIGVVGGMISSAFFLLISLLLRIHGYTGFITPLGIGSSGSTAGIGIITIILLIEKRKIINSEINNFVQKKLKFKIGFDSSYLVLSIVIFSLAVVIATLLMDYFLFSWLMYSQLYIIGDKNGLAFEFTWNSYLILSHFMKGIQGTPYLLHTICTILGIIIYFVDKKITKLKGRKIDRIDIQTKESISVSY